MEASGSGGILRRGIPIVFLVLSLLALKNVYEDNTEVVQLAETTACGKVGCAVRMLEEHRDALSQRYVFQLSVATRNTHTVECQRAYVFVGEYSCK